jgi:hypothetical protein
MASNTPTLVDTSAVQHEMNSLHSDSPKHQASEKEQQDHASTETPDDEEGYPGTVELTLITIGLCLAVFLVALVSCLPEKDRTRSIVDDIDVAGSNHHRHGHPQDYGQV